MTGAEVREAMKRGIDRFRHARSGREFALDPAQATLLEGDDADEVLLIGFPIQQNPRKRGRKWSWLAPKNLEIASQPVN